MRYEVRLTAYDMLDKVHVTARVVNTEVWDSPGGPAFEYTLTFPGRGEEDPREWLRQVLRAISF